MRLRGARWMAVAASLAMAVFLPLAFSHILVQHAISMSRDTLQSYAQRTIQRADARLDETASSLARIASEQSDPCGATSRDRLNNLLFSVAGLEQIRIFNGSGQVICSVPPTPRDHRIIAVQETLLEGLSLPIIQDVRTGQIELSVAVPGGLVATFERQAFLLDLFPEHWRVSGQMRFRVGDDFVLERLPEHSIDPELITNPDSTVTVTAQSRRYPLTVIFDVARSAILAENRHARAFATLAVSAMAATIVLLLLALLRRRWSAGSDINTALANNEFLAYYQPVISLETGALDGCEVLLRRRLPDGSVETPSRMIDLAEANGQIVPITISVMRRAIRDLGDLYRARPHLTMAFNLCALHFRSDRIVRDVNIVFKGAPVRTTQLIFEVTERQRLDDLVGAKTVVSKLQQIGCRVALDDAGTGHGGLATMQKLGLDIVKIDKVFIDPITGDTKTAPIVDKLLELASSLRMEVIAEGVETIEQVRYLKARGASLAQGFLFSPPIPPESFRKLVEAMDPPKSDPKPKASEAQRAA